MLIQLEKIPEGKAVAKTLGDEKKDSGKNNFPSTINSHSHSEELPGN